MHTTRSPPVAAAASGLLRSAQHLQLFFPIRPFSLLLSPSLRRRRPQIQKQKGVLETELESNPLRLLPLEKESCMASVPVLLSAVDKTCHQDPFSRTVHELSSCFKLHKRQTFGEKILLSKYKPRRKGKADNTKLFFLRV